MRLPFVEFKAYYRRHLYKYILFFLTSHGCFSCSVQNDSAVFNTSRETFLCAHLKSMHELNSRCELLKMTLHDQQFYKKRKRNWNNLQKYTVNEPEIAFKIMFS